MSRSSEQSPLVTARTFDYEQILAIDHPIPASRQGARRHYGVHPYFTRRPFNVVRDYVSHYSRRGDVVLDPFGGSGVTAIEAFLANRIGVQNDINPFANFIATGVIGLLRGSTRDYWLHLEEVQKKYQTEVASVKNKSCRSVEELELISGFPATTALPRNADVKTYRELFTPTQQLSLMALRAAVDSIETDHVREGFLLAWSATLAKLNRTFLSAEGRAESRGGSSIFSIYRYKIAKAPVELPAWPTFEERVKNVIAAKRELDKILAMNKLGAGATGEFIAHQYDIEELSECYRSKVDYIFTDPPYGGHISYLDLSTLWNSWLGLSPKAGHRQKELIVGGDQGISEQVYIERLGRSVELCISMLKPGRWLSIVFQHWSVEYFREILTAAARAGGNLRAAVSQIGDPIWSMHKKKGKESVLAGEMILTFRKEPGIKRKPKAFSLEDTVMNILSQSRNAVFGEVILNRLVVEAWNAGAIEALAVSKSELIDLLRDQGWEYEAASHEWRRGQAAMGALF